MDFKKKGIVFACSMTLMGALAFSGAQNVNASADSTAFAGASAALASAVAGADARVTAEENEKARQRLIQTKESAAEAAAARAVAEQKAADEKAEAEEERARAAAQEEADRAAAASRAAVEQAIAEQEAASAKKVETASEDVPNADVDGEEEEGIEWDGNEASEVVNYATRFVGNPYVWGGTSLTNGTDCSGFTMSVYKKFGKSLPHSSGAQRNVGTAVSVEEMKPGDIVCYSGHVALYCGNDTIVHASNPSTGIKYSNVYYRQILAVRRVF